MSKNNNILLLIESSPDQILHRISARVKLRRLEMEFTQKELAQRAGIPLPTYRRFEQTGEISLRSLVMLAIVLEMTSDFEKLFAEIKYASIDDILKQKKERKRGKKNGKY